MVAFLAHGNKILRGFPGSAVRMGRYKLIESFEHGRLQLFDLQNDLGEQNDLAAEMPDKVVATR